MHFLNVAECYWHNPDVNSIQVFGKDIRTLLSISCQKIFFHKGHTFYHYGPIATEGYRDTYDLQVKVFGEAGRVCQACEPPARGRYQASVGAYVAWPEGPRGTVCAPRPLAPRQVSETSGEVIPHAPRGKRSKTTIVITDRVYEYSYLRGILRRLMESAAGVRLKTDDAIINLTLLSLILDFGLFEAHAACLNLPHFQSLKGRPNTRQLQADPRGDRCGGRVESPLGRWERRVTGSARRSCRARTTRNAAQSSHAHVRGVR